MDTGRDTNIPDARRKDWLNASKTNSFINSLNREATASIKSPDDGTTVISKGNGFCYGQ